MQGAHGPVAGVSEADVPTPPVPKHRLAPPAGAGRRAAARSRPDGGRAPRAAPAPPPASGGGRRYFSAPPMRARRSGGDEGRPHRAVGVQRRNIEGVEVDGVHGSPPWKAGIPRSLHRRAGISRPVGVDREKMSRIMIRREPLTARTAPPGDGFMAVAVRWKPPARCRSFGISRRTLRIGGRCKDSDSPGNPSARTHPGEGFMAMAAHRKLPLRAVGRLAYRAEQCVSRENVNDSDPSGNPSLHEPRPPGTVSWRWQLVRASPCASSVAWHIAPDGGLAAKAAATGAFCRKGGVRRMLSGR